MITEGGTIRPVFRAAKVMRLVHAQDRLLISALPVLLV